MKKIAILSSLLAICFVIAAQTQTAAPKPAPELKQLHGLLGHWTYECEYHATPLGPAGKCTGEATYRMVLGGFHMQAQYTEKAPAGELQAIEIDGYDPAAKSFTYDTYSNDESTWSGTYTFNGNTQNAMGKISIAGKQYLVRHTNIWKADWMTASWKAEMSTDGKTWMPWWEMKMTKVNPAAKK